MRGLNEEPGLWGTTLEPPPFTDDMSFTGMSSPAEALKHFNKMTSMKKGS